MQKHRIIRGFTAGAMLMLFVLSIMPKLYLHDIFAGHQDVISNSGHSDAIVVKAGYSCDVNDLVATSPFTESDEIAELNQAIDFPVFHTRYTSQIATAAPPCFTLRGPPMLA